MDEKKLIGKIQQGSEEALEELIQYFYPQIYSYVYARMHGKDCAADITQEVFIRFMRQLPTFENQGKVKHYLLRIAVNQCNEWYRGHKDIQLEEETLLESISMTSEEVTIDRDHLLSFLYQLPSEQQEVLLLKYFRQLKSKEIAVILHISESTVKTRIRLGLKKLKNLTGKEEWL